MKSTEPEIPNSSTFAPTRQIGGSYYSNFVQPVKSIGGRGVGVISVFDDISDEHRILHQAGFN
jgi:hypothetical protein